MFVVMEGGRACVGRLVFFIFTLGDDGMADLGEGGREVVHGVDEGGAGTADGDADEVDSSPISATGGQQGEVLVGLLSVLLVIAEVHAKAHLYEDDGAVLPIEGVDVGGWVGWHSSCVDDVGDGFCSFRH